MNHPTLRLTPSNSPFSRSTAPRSPIKALQVEEPGLRLIKAIGSTTASALAFDLVASQRTFAYAAGAIAVLCRVDHDGQVTQRFYKARPTVAVASRDVSQAALDSRRPFGSRDIAYSRENGGATGSPLAASRDWSDSPGGRSTTAKDRVKSVTSVALSPDGRWLAIGETGFKPRILIFSLSEDSFETPVSTITEHAFGIHALRFSPDSRRLASLGTVNDGFLYVWSIDARGVAALYASNKCTSIVNAMAWMGRSIVTVGLRFAKVWRPDEIASPEASKTDLSLTPGSPRHRADNRSSDYGNSILGSRKRILSGKNRLLGTMLDSNFTAVAVLSSTQVAVCAESGEVCLLDDAEESQEIRHVATSVGCVIRAVYATQESLRVFGNGSNMTDLPLSDLYGPSCPCGGRPRTSVSPVGHESDTTAYTVAAGQIDSCEIRLDSHGAIQVGENSDNASDVPLFEIPGHGQPLAGVVPVYGDDGDSTRFATFTAAGDLRLWDTRGQNIERCRVPLSETQDLNGMIDSLTTVVAFEACSLVAYGTKIGLLGILDLGTGVAVTGLRAHSSEIVDIFVFKRKNVQLLATVGRDRVVQLFRWHEAKLELLQTMDEHAAAVTGVLAASNGEKLLSSSADRSIVVREAWQRRDSDPTSVAFVISRTIAFKAAPTTMCFGPDENTLLVATLDRQVSRYSIKYGMLLRVFKPSDSDNGEAAVISKLMYVTCVDGEGTILGISSSDKSLRVYSEHGRLLGRDWGHTEGVTGLALVRTAEDESSTSPWRVVTVAADSTCFIWDSKPTSPGNDRGSDAIPELSSPARLAPAGPPLRKVISFSELSRFKRQNTQEDGDIDHPSSLQSPTNASPPRLRKKTSRMTLAKTPKLEPAFGSSVLDPSRRSSRRHSLRQRSPSPPSPKTTLKRQDLRRPSMNIGTSLRSKSTENISKATSSPPINTGFGSLTASTASAARTLGAFRKKLASAKVNDNITPEALRELEKELKLTAKALGEREKVRGVEGGNTVRGLDRENGEVEDGVGGGVEECGVQRKRVDDSAASGKDLRGSPTTAGPEAEEGTDTLAGAVNGLSLES
ncbi:hypothetical protein LTR62_006217 [Meristemomyces frigidus]|uniref:WD40 repeat-like protein n=1 Tax=Meristemomyces frigidus TaxID=1508187 RepID=A0AAN7TDU5_9PEZI|nr:hypothetical protein LTR62_006217 [Meristemomyces frigidus]